MNFQLRKQSEGLEKSQDSGKNCDTFSRLFTICCIYLKYVTKRNCSVDHVSLRY